MRPHVNKVIVELQLLWGMTPTKAGKDVVDFFTYETAERPEWISKNKKTKQGDTQ